ncbi:unnamed protein product [Lymnaea stagnalis]|uniref:Alpha-type protein kinase domain-containing protein n=1 Tax=Lymnaea stagnalis TaxID=6523 RepID=A0AAV2HFS7_LYMST
MRYKALTHNFPKKRMGLIQVDNKTEMSDTDRWGERYAANFEFFPFHEGGKYSLYKGVLNGSSFVHSRHGHMCVVRTLRNRCAESEGEWEPYLRIARETEKLIPEFNCSVGRKVFSFVAPFLTCVEQKSSFVSLFRLWNPHDKRFKPDEYVVVEPYIQCHFRRLDLNTPAVDAQGGSHCESHNVENSRTENSSAKSCSSKKSVSPSSKNKNSLVPASLFPQSQDDAEPELTAFGHYTWHRSGKFVVTNLRGAREQEGSPYKLVTPTIHSVSRSYGETDDGAAGIIDFFDHHVCNTICYAWGKYEEPNANCTTGHVTQHSSSLNQPD